MKRIPSRSAIVKFADGGRNATGVGAAMIIFRLLLGPPNCNARSSYCKAFPISNPWQSSQFQYVSIRPPMEAAEERAGEGHCLSPFGPISPNNFELRFLSEIFGIVVDRRHSSQTRCELHCLARTIGPYAAHGTRREPAGPKELLFRPEKLATDPGIENLQPSTLPTPHSPHGESSRGEACP